MGEGTFRSITELAERCGHYCWWEHRLFTLTGAWASAASSLEIEGEIRVLCSEMSSWHGFVAGQWRERLPMRAGVDPDALIIPPPGPPGLSGASTQALDPLSGEEPLPGVEAVVGQLVDDILPGLLEAYDEDLARASLVSEAPVVALLRLIRPQVQREIEQGRALLGHSR